MSKFVAIVYSKEVRGSDGTVITDAGTSSVVVNSEWGETSRRHENLLEFPAEARVWRTQAAAEKWLEKWEGHPWYCKPQGFAVIGVVPVHRKVLNKFKAKK